VQVHDRHLDEAEFLFGVLDAALDAPHYSLALVAQGPERRLLAHVDALIVAGPQVCERLLLPTLSDPSEDPTRVAAATLALAEFAILSGQLGTQQGTQPDVLAALRVRGSYPPQEVVWAQILKLHDACESAPHRAAILRGLGACSSEALAVWVSAQLPGARGFALAGRIDLLSDRRSGVEKLADCLVDPHPAVARAAAQAAALSHDRALIDRLAPLGNSSDPEIRRAAIESALTHYIPGAWASALYWAFTDAPSPFRRRALIWVAALGDATVHAWLIKQLADPPRRANVLWALGFCGRIAAVDAALEWLEDEQLGRLAGEVVTAIAGLPTDQAGCWRRPPEPDEDQSLPALTHDRLDADLVPAAEDALPVPEPAGVRAWWSARRQRLDPRLRHLGGRPLTPAVLVEALHEGPMRRRHALALELAMRSGGQLQLRTRQTTTRQRDQLAGLPDLQALDLQRGLRSQ
jgi:uncharacterized protein (TIGR02270 family)